MEAHNPHNTLMYSMTRYDDRLQAAMKAVADADGSAYDTSSGKAVKVG